MKEKSDHKFDDVARARERLRLSLARTAKKAARAGLQGYFGGNLSVRLGAYVDGAPTFLVKKSGASFARCRPEDFLEVDPDGRPVGAEDRPTKEIWFHLGIYRERPEVNAIIHVHSPWSIAAGEIHEVFPLCTDQARTHLRDVPLLPPAPAGSADLAERVVAAFAGGVRAAILRRHGVVCVGKDLEEAEDLAELLEESALLAVILSFPKGAAFGCLSRG